MGSRGQQLKLAHGQLRQATATATAPIHDSYDMANQQQQHVAYLADFGGGPTPTAAQLVRLPTHRDFPTPLTDSELLDAQHRQLDREIDAYDDLKLIMRIYARACHPNIDDMPKPSLNPIVSDPTIQAFEHCHNGLCTARRGACLEGEQVYHLAKRLITWLQDQDEAKNRLGPYQWPSSNWWIAPAGYVLEGHSSGVTAARYGGAHMSARVATPVLGDPTLFGVNSHQPEFHAAKFTIHFVHF